MPGLSSFITYKPRRKKAVVKSPFALLRGELSTSAPTGFTPKVEPEVIDIKDNGSSLDFDGGKPIDDYENDLVDRPLDSLINTNDGSPQLDLDISPEALTDWFTTNFMSLNSVGGEEQTKEIANGSGLRNEISLTSLRSGVQSKNVAGNEKGDNSSLATSEEDNIANLQSMNPSHFGKLPGYDNFKRLNLTTSPTRLSPNVTTPTQNGQGLNTSFNSISIMDTPLSSAISGTTIARALMSNTYVLPNDQQASRYRTVGLTRSDSTTLPRNEHSFGAGYNDRFSIGPDAPPIPSNAELLYKPPKRPRNPDEELREKAKQISHLRRSSTGSVNPVLDTFTAVSNRPASALFSPGIEFDMNSLLPASPEARKPPSLPRSPLPPTPKHPYSSGANSTFTVSNITDLYRDRDPIQRFPVDSNSASPDMTDSRLLSPPPSSEGLLSERNLDDVLNYYSLPDTPEPLVVGATYRPVFSPISEESTSQLSPPTPYNRERRESQRSLPTPPGARSPFASNLRVRGELPRLPIGSRQQSGDTLSPLFVSNIFARQRQGAAPSPIKVVRDSKDSKAYNITVTPNVDTPADENAFVQQDFPETPYAFSPVFTPGSHTSSASQSMDGHHDGPAIPSVPLSAALPSRSPSLAQQVLLARAGTTVVHERQISASKIKINELVGGRSESPSSRQVDNIVEESPIDSSWNLKQSNLKVSSNTSALPSTEDLPSRSKEEIHPANNSVVTLSRVSSLEQSSDSSSLYASSESSSRVRMKSLPPIPHSAHSISPRTSISSPLAAIGPSVVAGPATIGPPQPSYPPPPVPTFIPPFIPPPPPLPPPSPTPSQKMKVFAIRGKPPALTITNASSGDRTLAVNGTDATDGISPESYNHEEPDMPAEPSGSTAATSETNIDNYKDENYTGRASDIFRGTSLGSPPPYYTVLSDAINQHVDLADNNNNANSNINTDPSTNNVTNTNIPKPPPPPPVIVRPSLTPRSSTSTELNSSLDLRVLARDNSTASQRGRIRPPLPVGPRRPSMMAGTLGHRDRSGSVSSVASTNPLLVAARTRLDAAAPIYSPKFQTPPPKWRGYTMEAAKWTFSSAQLQAIVSRAIRQSAEASSIRLLRVETLDNEIPDEIRRLEAQRIDLKTKYKVLTRRRATFLDALSIFFQGEEENSSNALRLVEDVREINVSLDKLAEELHSLDGQLAYLDSLSHIHMGSALAMALRKLNTSFVRQVAENQVLLNQIQMIEAERDEAWKHAERLANEYDRIEMADPLSSQRSSLSAVKKSSIRVSKAGLRTPSQRLSQVSSLLSPSSIKSPTYRSERVPPVPPIPSRSQTLDIPINSPIKSSAGLSPMGVTPISATSELVQAQDELYAMLGLSNPERSIRKSRSTTMLSRSPSTSTNRSTHLHVPNHPNDSNHSSWRRSSLPGDTDLAETYNAMAADRNAILATIGMLSATD